MVKMAFSYLWTLIILGVCPWVGWYLATLVRDPAQLWAAYAFVSPVIAMFCLTHVMKWSYRPEIEEGDHEVDQDISALVAEAASKLGYQSPVVHLYRDEERRMILSLDDANELRINRHLFDCLSKGEMEFGILKTLSSVNERQGNRVVWTFLMLTSVVFASGLAAFNPWLIIPTQAICLVGMAMLRFSYARTSTWKRDKLALELMQDPRAAKSYITYEEKLSSTKFLPGLGVEGRLKALGL